jgi:UDP-4-amino-4-deoxy-L-arabinose-oxoglutarate aminotransferase
MIAHSKPWITDSDLRAVDTVLTSGMIAQGKLVREFEVKVAQYLGVADGVAVNSGTAALVLALKALGVGPNCEVIIPTYVCKSVAEAVISAGARPILCDVGDEWNMTVETVALKVTPRTAAIIVVHIYGIPADTYSFKKFGVPIIEDACQAFGASIHGAKVGTIGTIGVFSFHATKCLTTGEGGMAVSNDPDLIERMRVLRDGLNFALGERVASPMTDLQAALGLSQLSRYSEFLSRRKEIADLYFTKLSECHVQLPKAIREKSIFFRFPLRVQGDFDMHRQQFEKLGVHVRRGVDALLHRIMGLDKHLFPVAEKLFAETVSIPIYPALKEKEVETVIEACHTIWGSRTNKSLGGV